MKCLFCKSSKILKQGYRKNSTGKKQKYQCINCKKWFVKKDGFERMRHNKKIISRAIHMHNDGLSLFQVKNHLWQHDGVKVTRRTISEWTKKYSVFLK
jgi:putative transposase